MGSIESRVQTGPAVLDVSDGHESLQAEARLDEPSLAHPTAQIRRDRPCHYSETLPQKGRAFPYAGAIMARVIHMAAMVLATCLTFIGLSACGGGGIPGNSVAVVGGTPITKSELTHWMSTMAGGDFDEISGIIAPKGLVSDPPNYGACMANLKTLAPSYSGAELQTKCQQLYAGLKEQALVYLISSQVSIAEGAEQGVEATPQEINRAFNRLRAERFPTEAQLQQYLASRGWSLSDELHLVKLDVLSLKLLPKLRQKYSSERALIRYSNEAAKRWKGRTSCRPGFVVQGCSNYIAPPKPPGPSPAVLVEEIAQHHPTAPVKTAPDLECKNQGKKLACEPVG
jgi:hypothetical protein